MNDGFIIPLNGLATGKNEYSWTVGKGFFESFENAEIIDAELNAVAVVEKSGRYIGVDCNIEGTVTVECDRCLERLDLPVETEVCLSVKYGNEEPSDDMQDGEREVIFVREDEAELDMSQIIYDYVCLSLPMQRVHEDGECNPETVSYLGSANDVEIADDSNNPFSALKGLFD